MEKFINYLIEISGDNPTRYKLKINNKQYIVDYYKDQDKPYDIFYVPDENNSDKLVLIEEFVTYDKLYEILLGKARIQRFVS